jgi:cytochrome b
VWDVPTRLFHWGLALLVAANLVTGKFDSLLGASTLEWHRRFGYAILALVAFRLVWGFAGGTHARFAAFVRGPGEVIAYARRLVAGDPPPSVGHNPLGGWSVVAMIVAVTLQAVTGLFLVQEDYGFNGPLSRFVSNATTDRLNAIHKANFWVIAGLVALHVAAIVAHTVRWREDLAGAMLSGTKRLPERFADEASRGGGWFAVLVAFGVALAVAAGLVALG